MRKRGWIKVAAVAAVLCITVAGCKTRKEATNPSEKTPTVTEKVEVSPTPEETEKVQSLTEDPVETETMQPTVEPTIEPTEEPTKQPKEERKVIVIDPGHQSKQNSSLEAVAPGSTEKKKKVSSGTEGKFTRVPEYKVALSVSKRLKTELESLGYDVIMTRETNDVNISNIERAEIANEAGADAFIRIHCDGSEDSSVHGMLTLCPTKNNPYCKSIYKDSYALAKNILDEMVAATGAKDRGIMQTDTMSGINWSKVPVTIVEMGYMSNKEEDYKLVSKEYQKELVQGIVNGVEKYFADK